MLKSKRVGLFLFTREEEGLVAWLQARGRHNVEKECRPESYAGALQPTCHGGVEEEDEDDIACLLRELKEELGPAVHEYLMSLRDEFKLVAKINGTATYGLIVPYQVIQSIRFHPSTGGLRCLSRSDVVRTLEKEQKKIVIEGYPAMFLDDKEALLNAFQFLA